MPTDPRHIAAGRVIPTSTYCDQPYIVRTDDGAWLCALTTGAGREGQHGQHVVAMRSTDCGVTWSQPVALESPDGPEASYSVLLKAATGRVYCFYNHNTDNIREVPNIDGSMQRRVDSLGHYVFRYSDDHGVTWSALRYDVPMREFEIDRENMLGGATKFFWNVGRPLVLNDGTALLVMHKVGNFGPGFFVRSEGAFMHSPNIMTADDPNTIQWQTLPDGEVGLRTPEGGGPVAEEHSVTQLSDGSLFCVYRTIDGHSVCSYSRDVGRTWSPPRYMAWQTGKLMKHPRAANFCWRAENGRFVYWFHNHGGRFIRGTGNAGRPYEDRNPAWLMGAVEADSPEGKVLAWSQPEIAIYEDDPIIRTSYPDFLEEGGRYYISETQKSTARIHEIDRALLEGMWAQLDDEVPMPQRDVDPPAIELVAQDGQPLCGAVDWPDRPMFSIRDHTRADHGTRDLRAGLTIDMLVTFNDLSPGQVLLDNRTPDGRGIVVAITPSQTLGVSLFDGQTIAQWDSDRGCLEPGKEHHVAIIIDGGPKLILFVIDGVLCDGGDDRQFGFGRYSQYLKGVDGDNSLRIAPSLSGNLWRLRIHHRACRVAEVV